MQLSTVSVAKKLEWWYVVFVLCGALFSIFKVASWCHSATGFECLF